MMGERRIQTFDKVEKIVEKWSEVFISDWCYDGIVGYMRVEGNPYEGRIWQVVNDLQYVDNITRLELKIAEDMDEDYDVLEIDFVEIYPKMSREELEERQKKLLGIE